MLPKENRLRAKAEIDLVFRRGRVISSQNLLIKYLSSQSTTSRVAVLVGKKISKKATQRNRIKRRLREVLRINTERLPISTDLLVIVRSIKLATTSWEDLTEELLSTLSKISNHETIK